MNCWPIAIELFLIVNGAILWLLQNFYGNRRSSSKEPNAKDPIIGPRRVLSSHFIIMALFTSNFCGCFVCSLAALPVLRVVLPYAPLSSVPWHVLAWEQQEHIFLQ